MLILSLLTVFNKTIVDNNILNMGNVQFKKTANINVDHNRNIKYMVGPGRA